MNSLASLPRIAVLSFGNSVSTELAHDIGYALDVWPPTANARDLADFTLQDPWPLHTNLIVSQDLLADYAVVFLLKNSSVDTILLNLISNHYKKWNQRSIEPTAELAPFEFTDWIKLAENCNGYIDWHQYYVTMLNSPPKKYVVIYEDMVQQQALSGVYLPMYTNKQELILNYTEVVAFIEQYQPRMDVATAPFKSFVNSFDIVGAVKSAL